MMAGKMILKYTTKQNYHIILIVGYSYIKNILIISFPEFKIYLLCSFIFLMQNYILLLRLSAYR